MAQHRRVLWCRSNTLIQSYTAHNGAVSKVAWHPSGNFLLSSSLDSTLKVRSSAVGHNCVPDAC